MPTITWEQFESVELRVGRVIEVEDFPEARKPAWKLTVDFGEQIATDPELTPGRTVRMQFQNCRRPRAGRPAGATPWS